MGVKTTKRYPPPPTVLFLFNQLFLTVPCDSPQNVTYSNIEISKYLFLMKIEFIFIPNGKISEMAIVEQNGAKFVTMG